MYTYIHTYMNIHVGIYILQIATDLCKYNAPSADSACPPVSAWSSYMSNAHSQGPHSKRERTRASVPWLRQGLWHRNRRETVNRICVNVFRSIYLSIYRHTHIYIYLCIPIYIYVYMYRYIDISINRYIQIYRQFPARCPLFSKLKPHSALTLTRLLLTSSGESNICIYIYMYMQIYTQIHTHTHTYV